MKQLLGTLNDDAHFCSASFTEAIKQIGTNCINLISSVRNERMHSVTYLLIFDVRVGGLPQDPMWGGWPRSDRLILCWIYRMKKVYN